MVWFSPQIMESYKFQFFSMLAYLLLFVSGSLAFLGEQIRLSDNSNLVDTGPAYDHNRYKLIHNGTIISFDEIENQVLILNQHSILIDSGTIHSIFPSTKETRVPSGAQIIQATGKIITPGFIDTHRHLWQAQYTTFATNTTLAEYIFRYGEFSAVQFIYQPDDIYYGMLKAIYQGLNGGTTTFVDHASSTWSTGAAFAGFNASVRSGARERDFREIAERCVKGLPSDWGLARLGIAYDNSYAENASTVRHIFELARDYNVSALTMHYVGGPWGLNNSPTLLNTIGVLNTSVPVLFAHGSFLTTQDAQLLRATNHYLVTTPESEMNFAQTNPTSHLIQDQAALGADTDADLMSQARIWLQHVRYRLFSQTLERWQAPRSNPMSSNQAFLLATRSGGLALKRPDLGILVPGAKADILVFDTDSPSLVGWTDPVSAVMLRATPSDIRHVLVDGQFRKREGKLVIHHSVGETWAQILDKYVASTLRIQRAIKDIPFAGLQGEFAPGVSYADPVQIDVIRGDGTGY